MVSSRLATRIGLLLTTSLAGLPIAQAQTQTQEADAQAQAQASGAAAVAAPVAGVDDLETIVVTGQTTRGRALITSSADITSASRAEIDRRAPRSTADLLELVPGIFVEGTAGELSNNYSVRGLQGGGQRFVQLQEDGLPIIYGGGGADFFFSQDLTIDRFEAVKGGSSGVLTVNGAGATINFISRGPNFNKQEAVARFTAFNYGLLRGDYYVSGPLGRNTAISIGGYVQSNPGVRASQFDYKTYQIKAALEHRFDSGGFVRATFKAADRSAAYYATQPYALVDGEVTGINGFDPQFGFIGGTSFGRIDVPGSTFLNADGFRPFRLSQGVRVRTFQGRIDAEKPVTDTISVFAHLRYLGLTDDFNGLFPGSSTGNAGLASAVNYLTSGPNSTSPIAGLLTAGRAAFPTTAQFGIRNLRNGVITPASAAGTLNALNGNGFLQQVTLNHDFQSGHDFGSNFGARWEFSGNGFKNSAVAGVMYYDVKRSQTQSSTGFVLSDVRTNAATYDVVALDAGNNVVGTLTDNGLVSYGNWGVGVRESRDSSVSVYLNDELQIGSKLRIDGGIRYESDDAEFRDGQPARTGFQVTTVNPDGSVCSDVRPVGLGGIIQPASCTTFGGQFTTRSQNRSAVSWTVGANYLIKPHFSIYGRYADGFQTNGVNPITRIELYEAGLRYQKRWLTASVTGFRTVFNNQFYQFIDPADPRRLTDFLADLSTNGVEIDATLRPIRWFSIDFNGVFQEPTLNNLRLNGVRQTVGFDGNRPERTPATLFTITPAIDLPGKRGQIYGRYKYIGAIFADSGNGLALPAYGVTSVGFSYNLNDRITLQFDAENIFDEVGLTEGNPRQGQTQNASSGFFYARGIVGPTYGGSITFRY